MDCVAKAINLTSTITANALGGGSLAAAKRTDEEQPQDDESYQVGDIIACVEKDSTVSQPRILLGKVLRTCSQRREVLLAYSELITNTRNKYRLKVGSSTWTESYDALIFPIDAVYDDQSALYTLRTKPRDSHALWLPLRQ